MTEIIIAIAGAVISYVLFFRKNKAEATKSELEVMRETLRIFKEFNSELTIKVDELRNEVNNLRDINDRLQVEINNLQTIINRR